MSAGCTLSTDLVTKVNENVPKKDIFKNPISLGVLGNIEFALMTLKILPAWFQPTNK